MAVLEINDLESQFSYSREGVHKRVNVYEVITDKRYEDPLDIFNAVSDAKFEARGLKVKWQWGDNSVEAGTEKDDDKTMLLSADVRLRSRREHRFVFNCVCTFESWSRMQQDNQTQETYENGPVYPWQEPPRWSGGFFHIEEEATVDVNGKRIVNSADQPYEGQVIEKAFDTIICELNTEEIDYDLRSQAVNTINDAAFWGFPAKTIKLKDWSYEIRYHGRDAGGGGALGKPYVVNRFEFHVKNDGDGWVTKLVNWGSALKEAGQNAVWRVITMPTSLGVHSAFTNLILEMSGLSIADPQPTDTTDYTNTFDLHRESSFNDLPVSAYDLPARKTGPG